MAALNDFKTFMATKLGQILGKEISPSEITLGTPSVPSNPAKRRLPIEYMGKHYPVIYEQFDIGKLFVGTSIRFVTSKSTIHDIVDLLNARYGVGLTKSEVLDGPIAPVTRVTILESSLKWKGFIDVVVKETVVLDQPLHDFQLNGSTANTGTSDTAMAVPFDYEVVGGRNYAVRKNAGAEPLGVTLPMQGDYVLDVEVLPAGTGENNVLFASSSGGPQGISVGAFMIGSDRRFYHGHLSTLGTPIANRPQMSATVPTRLTIRSLAGEITVYQNSVEITRYRPTGTIANYDVMGNASFGAWRTPNKLRAMRFWETGMEQKEFDLLLDPLTGITKPLHEYLLTENTRNTGLTSGEIAGPITFTTNAFGTWANLGGTSPITLPEPFTRPGDYTLDFEVMFPIIGSYACFLSTSPNVAGAAGSIWWYSGKCYEYGVSSGNAAIPVARANEPQRITLVRKAGKTTMYINGTFAQEYTGGNNSPFVCFRDGDVAGYQFSSASCLRKLRFWQTGLETAELAVLFAA